MPTDRDRIKQLQQRVDEVTGQLEKVSSERLRLEADRKELIKARDALGAELEATKAELEELRVERPALTFDQLGNQLRQGLAAVDAVDPGTGSSYQARSATFELKVAIDSDGEQAVLRLPAIGEAVDPGLLGTFKLEIGRASDADPDLTGLVLVPTLAGATAEGAADRLARAGLDVGETTARAAFGPPGSVVEQDPEGGAYVEPGTTIDLVLAASEVTVPDLSSLTLDGAADRLSALRLAVGDVTRHPSDDQTGTVIDQDPAAGRSVPVGSAVDLVVAAPAEREVPDLSGMTKVGAEQALAEAELRLGRVDERTSDKERGTVIDQRPAAGSIVGRDSAVAVVVAKPPVRRARPVPDVVGRTRSEANEVLRAADFAPKIIGTRPFENGADPATFDTIVEQEPQAGTPSAAAEVGLVVVASGEPTEVLPGIGPAMARRLARAGMRTVGDVAHSDPVRISEATGTSLVRAEAIRDAAIARNRPER